MKKYKLNILGDRKISEREMKDKLKLTLEKCANIGSKQGAIKMMHRVRRLRDEGFLIFIAFIIIAYLGKSNDIIPASYLSFLFLFAVIVLIVSITLYERTIKAEESNLNALLDSFLK